jgi:hypothetical protein
MGKKLKWTWHNLDFVLQLVAVAFLVIFGLLGVVSEQIVWTGILAVLGLVAISQLRGREQLQSIVGEFRVQRLAVFLSKFPTEYYAARESANDSYFYAGTSMRRTADAAAPHLRRILKAGGVVRVLLPNPENRILIDMIATSQAAGRDPSVVATRIRESIRVLREFPSAQGKLEIRTTEVLPRFGINIIDRGTPSALAVIQLYEFRPTADEAAPIMLLRESDGGWYHAYLEQADRLWEYGVVYQPVSASPND